MPKFDWNGDDDDFDDDSEGGKNLRKMKKVRVPEDFDRKSDHKFNRQKKAQTQNKFLDSK